MLAYHRALRSTSARIALLLAGLLSLWFVSATLGWLVTDEFDSYGEALWIGFRHMLDPAALGEDQTAAERALGVFQVLVGLTFFVGLLFTIVEEVVGGWFDRLADVDPPVRARGHVLILGWDDLVMDVVEAVAASTAAHRDRPTIVVVGPSELRGRRRELADRLSSGADGLRAELVLRDLEDPDDLDVGAARDASRIMVIPSHRGEATAADAADLESIRVGMLLRARLEGGGAQPPRTPPVLLLFRRGRNVDAAWELFPANFDAVVVDRAIAGIVGLAITRPGFVDSLPGLGSADGPRLVTAPADDLVGRPFEELVGVMAGALPLGLVRDGPAGIEVDLPPPADAPVRAGDRVAVLTSGDGEVTRRPDAAQLPPPVPVPGEQQVGGHVHSILVLGWAITVEELLPDLARRAPQGMRITLLDTPERLQVAWRVLEPAADEVLSVTTRAGSPIDPATIAAALADTEAQVVFSPATLSAGSYDAADARALLAALHATRLSRGSGVAVIADLYAGRDVAVGGHGDERLHVVSRRHFMAGWLEHAVARPELAAAVQSFFGADGGRLAVRTFRPPDGAAVSFAAVYRGLLAEGAVPVGLRDGGAGARPVPSPETQVAPGDDLLVLLPPA